MAMTKRKKTAASRAGTSTKKTSKKTTAPKRTVPAKKTTRTAPNPFVGATEVHMTKNKIVVTRVTSESKPGRYVKTETRDYLDYTPDTVAALERHMKKPAKKISVK